MSGTTSGRVDPRKRGAVETRLSGWGRTAWTVADVARVDSPADVVGALARVGARGAIARGMGRAYGAAAQNSGGTVIEYLAGAGDKSLSIDEESGVLTASAGVSIESILAESVPRGWFVPVTPGTRQISLGGAVASDVHGKNHHADGSFCDHVESIDVMLSNGESVRLGPSRRPDWYWATVGGMGLTGVITGVTVRMTAIETPLMRVRTMRAPSIDALLGAMSPGADGDDRYTVAWIDLMAGGRNLGRGVLTSGDHARREELTTREARRKYHPGTRLRVPSFFPGGMLNKHTIRAFNGAWYRRAPRIPGTSLESIPAFFHPLDGVRDWNRLYGPRGFVQYQFIVPLGREDDLRSIVERFSTSGIGSFLAVLKRMGPGNSAPLSFPTEGWTLALDVPSGSDGLAALLRSVDEMVIEAGGRHYLAKDCHLQPWAVRAGYPRLGEWQAIRAEMDPPGFWISDLARRLEIVPSRPRTPGDASRTSPTRRSSGGRDGG